MKNKRILKIINCWYWWKIFSYFFKIYDEYGKSQPIADQLFWSHYDELLKLTDENIINYYIKISEEQNLTVKKLREKIMKK